MAERRGFGSRPASLGSGRVEYTEGVVIVHFGSPEQREAKRRALAELFGTDIADWQADRVILGDDVAVRSVN